MSNFASEEAVLSKKATRALVTLCSTVTLCDKGKCVSGLEREKYEKPAQHERRYSSEREKII